MSISYVKDDKFYWEDSLIRIVFSEPSIQFFKDDLPGNVSQIMYYYYTVDVYRNMHCGWDEVNNVEKRRWRRYLSIGAFDFPALLNFRLIIDELLRHDGITDSQKMKYGDGLLYITSYSTDGFGVEDYYKLTKYVAVDEENRRTWYALTVGSSFGGNFEAHTSGIEITAMPEEDVISLKQTVDGFIDYSINEANKLIEDRNQAFLNSLETIDGHLYELKKIYDKEKGTEISSNIDSIYAVGDNVSISCKSEYYDVYGEIEEIDNSSLKINDKRYDFSDITYIFHNPDETSLYYNMDDVSEDFFLFMNNKEREDFIGMDEDAVYEKYESAIANRTWMYRDEHNFPFVNELIDDNRENIKEVIKIVIKNIKEKIKAS